MYHRHQSSCVLIASLGTEPQVVTSTIDLLIADGYAINEVHVVHTTAPGTLLAEAVVRLKDALEDYTGLRSVFHAVSDGHGLLSDVETPEASLIVFRLLYDLIRQVKLAEQCVHLCLAGGRKTMALYGMAAAQLLFDDEDRFWYLFSAGSFLTSKRMHPEPGDDTHLVPVPVLLWQQISPVSNFHRVADPLQALEQYRQLRLQDQLESARSFVLGALTPAERRAVTLLVEEGLGDQEIAARLVLSPRTVEQQLRAAYSKAAAHWGVESVTRTQLVTLLHLYFAMQIRGNPA